jgi:hypothetical protein
MESKQAKRSRKDEATEYDLRTPLLDKYLREMRKHIRFPRYYKRSLNW